MLKSLILLILVLGMMLFALETEGLAFSNREDFGVAQVNQGTSVARFTSRDLAASAFVENLNLRHGYSTGSYSNGADKAQFLLKGVKRDGRRKKYLWRKKVAGLLVDFEEEEDSEEGTEGYWLVEEEAEEESEEEEEKEEEEE